MRTSRSRQTHRPRHAHRTAASSEESGGLTDDEEVDMTQLIGTSGRVREQRREVLAELHRVQLTLETAVVLDRTAGRLANRRLAEVLHECAEERRRVAHSVRAGLTARIG
jgi:hypothetical protein